MKKANKLFNLFLPLLVITQLSTFAQNENNNGNFKKYEFSKNKSVNRSYTVSASDKLSINNSFGKVEIHTWDRNEIKVDISIEVSASKEDIAQKIIDGINIKDAQNGKEISFKTSIKGNNNSGGGKSAMTVNYSISMPATNPLSIENDCAEIALNINRDCTTPRFTGVFVIKLWPFTVIFITIKFY